MDLIMLNMLTSGVCETFKWESVKLKEQINLFSEDRYWRISTLIPCEQMSLFWDNVSDKINVD